MQGDGFIPAAEAASIPTALVDRLSAATAGSRELDALIWLRFNRPEYTGDVKALEMRGWYDGRGHLILETDAGEEVADDLWIGNYTTSIDAALALAERVLPGCYWLVGKGRTRPDEPLYGVRMMAGEGAWHDPTKLTAEAEAPTPALALCIAVLKAVAAQSPTEQVGTDERSEGVNQK